MVISFTQVNNINMKRTEIIDGKITCSRCKETKDLRYFCKRPENNSYRGTCRKCSKGYELCLQDKQEQIQELFNIGLKECGRCKVVKTLDNFGSDKHTKFGVTSNCKTCVNSKPRHLVKNNSLKSKYNISLADFKQMILNQGGNCAICKTKLYTLDIKSVHTDHCHTTGKVRGILCKYCNFGLGWFKDNTKLLENAITYLKFHAND